MKEKTITEERMNLFREYLLQEEKSEATVEKYMRDIRFFAHFAGEEAVTKDIVKRYKEHLINAGYAVSSVNSMLAGLNSFLSFFGWGECKVKNIRQQRDVYCREEKNLTKEEYLRLIGACGKNSQLKLIIQSICSTGIRVSELKYFTVEGLREGEITVRCKGKVRRILIPSKLRKMLMGYAKKCGIASGCVFVGRSGKALHRTQIWRMMKSLCRKAGVEESKVFPHNLRKLFAKTFYRIEKDIAKLADILGHSSINTTRIYIMSTGVEHRRKIEKLGLV